MPSSSSLSSLTFRTHNGRYLGWHHGKIVALATDHPIPGATVHVSAGVAEQFLARIGLEGEVIIGKELAPGEGKYLGVNGGVVTLLDDPYPWRPVVTPDGRLALAAEDGRFLSPRGGGGGDVALGPARRASLRVEDALLPSTPFAEWDRAKPPKAPKSTTRGGNRGR